MPLKAHAHIAGSIFIAAAAIVAGVVGLLILPLVSLPFAAAERARLRLLTGQRISSGHQPRRNRGLRAWALLRIGEGATWREVVHFVITPVLGILITVGIAIEVVFVGSFAITPFIAVDRTVRIGTFTMTEPMQTWPLVLAALLCLVLFVYLNTIVALTFGCITEGLLHVRDHKLMQQVLALGHSRSVIIDSFDTERRKIERDLHDGVQQRLVNSALTLGLIHRQLQDESVRPLVERAIGQNKATLESLRETIMGISPMVLTDHGLAAALRSLTDGSSLNVTLLFDPPELADVRSDPRVELAAYYIVNEALTNVAKHAGVTRAVVTVGGDLNTVTVKVVDQGNGRANPSGGTGLAGLIERAAVLDGQLTVSSDAKGTKVVASLPRQKDDDTTWKGLS